MWVFSSVGGLITCRPDGKIHSVNTHFSLNLIGSTESEIKSQVDKSPPFFMCFYCMFV